jgi:formyltetrahydrofolate-dependent phosphoribosylglycinamide formyltransferase
VSEARIVVLASGNGTNLQAVLDACAAGRIPATVVAVVSDKAGAYALERATLAGIPIVLLPRQPGEPRPEYDDRLREAVAGFTPDWVVLAGFMRLLTQVFLDAFPNRVVNLHPALPGEVAGMHAIARAWQAGHDDGLARTGVMVHLVPDERVDAGPVLGTTEVPIVAGEPLDALEARVHAAERALLVATLADLCAGRMEASR